MKNLAPETGFVKIEQLIPLIQATDGLTLSQICKLTELESSTIQNWVKRRFVPAPVAKKYGERHLARILLIKELRDCVRIENVGKLMEYINGDADDTFDDIISEQELYAYFSSLCEMLLERKNDDSLDELVREVTKSYSAEFEKDRQRLEKALTIMGEAFLASYYKQKADALLDRI